MRGFQETALFTSAMLMKLNTPKNSAKKHWLYLSMPRLLWLLIVEVFELAAAVLTLFLAERKYRRQSSGENHQALLRARQAVLSECSDVGNFAMMVADNCNALREVRYANTDRLVFGLPADLAGERQPGDAAADGIGG